MIQPGVLSLIQDAGRFGRHNIGLTTGGPADPLAFRWANRLLGNEAGSAAIEITAGGLELEAETATRVVVTGAEVEFSINGQQRENWTCHRVQPGDTLGIGFATRGMRTYLAVAGGIDLPPMFGSVATVVREGIGGLDGGPLASGDLLPCRADSLKLLQRLPESARPRYSGAVELRLVPGYQQAYFDSHQQWRLTHYDYEVSERCDRMGYRLVGAEITCALGGILSEGICYGAVQVPADGQPIVLLNDRQTIGGYPKIGSVLSLDAARLAQLGQGGKVRFSMISPFAAHNELVLAEQRFDRLQPEVLA